MDWQLASGVALLVFGGAAVGVAIGFVSAAVIVGAVAVVSAL